LCGLRVQRPHLVSYLGYYTLQDNVHQGAPHLNCGSVEQRMQD
jgi:hypothetical protein